MTRDPESDKITRVTFTCEGPEYWQFLAAVSPARVVELYRQHISPDVQQADLFQGGRYRPRNNGTSRRPRARCTWCRAATRWARKSSSPRPPPSSAGGRRADHRSPGADRLRHVRRSAAAQRSAHRRAGQRAGARQADITLANPVGLYIAGLSVAGWLTPDSSTRRILDHHARHQGEGAARRLRSAGRPGFVVGDIKIDGRPIEFAAQITDFIRIKLTGLATRLGQSTVAPVNGCVEFASDDATADAAAPSVESVLAGMGLSGIRS